MFSLHNKMESTPPVHDPTNAEQVLKKIETIHPPEYVQAIKDFLDKKITYEQMQKICNPGQKHSCCEDAK